MVFNALLANPKILHDITKCFLIQKPFVFCLTTCIFLKSLRQDPLEAILVIFGRTAFIFFFLFESSWKNMKNDTNFVRMRSGDHLGDAKISKKGSLLR